MTTPNSTPVRKTSARKLAAQSAQSPEPAKPAAKAPSKPAAVPKPTARAESPLVDAPPVKGQKALTDSFKKAHSTAIKAYVNSNFESIEPADMDGIINEVADCFVQKRSPKKGGIWGDSVEVIEDILTAVVAPAEEAAPSEPDSGMPPDEANIDNHHGDAPEDEGLAEAIAVEASERPTMFKKPAREKGKPRQGQPLRSVKKAEAPATTKKPATDLEALKKLKGRERWFAAVEMLRKTADIRIQAQDMEEVMGHLYEVSIGKAKLKEEGFEGKGEKSYRRARILGFKTKVEALLAKVK